MIPDTSGAATRWVTVPSAENAGNVDPCNMLGGMARKIATQTTVDRYGLLDFVRPRHRVVLATSRGDGTSQMSPNTMGVDDDGASAAFAGLATMEAIENVDDEIMSSLDKKKKKKKA